MITILVGFCESLTFYAPKKVNTVGNIANACQTIRFPEVGVFSVTNCFDAESHFSVTYSY